MKGEDEMHFETRVLAANYFVDHKTEKMSDKIVCHAWMSDKETPGTPVKTGASR